MQLFRNEIGEMFENTEGKPVVWRPSAYGVLENEKGEWFMVEPTWTTRMDFPGGGVEKGELLREAVMREFYEETGYRVKVAEQPMHVGQANFAHKTLGFCHAVTFLYKVELVNGARDEYVVNTFEDGNEIADSRWVNPASVKEEDVSPIFWEYIQKAQKN